MRNFQSFNGYQDFGSLPSPTSTLGHQIWLHATLLHLEKLVEKNLSLLLISELDLRTCRRAVIKDGEGNMIPPPGLSTSTASSPSSASTKRDMEFKG